MPACDDDIQEAGQALDRVQLHLEPQRDALVAQSVTDLGQRQRHRLEPRGDGGESLRQGREVTREQQEDGVADLLARGHASLPESMHLAIEQCPAGTQDGQLAFQPIGCRQSGRIERLKLGEISALEVVHRQSAGARHVTQPLVLVMDAQICREHRFTLEHLVEMRPDQCRQPMIRLGLEDGHADTGRAGRSRSSIRSGE